MKLKVKSEKLKVQNSKNFDIGTIINCPKGITLIALVITIVVLIILAGVAINLTLGENGIFKRAEEAKQRESESSARERLELVLVDARIEKETNASYNSEDYLTEMLEEENITVSGDNVIVDNYNFVIDREKLEVLESLGETQIKVTAEVQEYLGKNENDKYAVSMLLVIESNTSLQSVVIQNPDGTTFEMTTEQVKLGKDMEIELDEEYILTVTTKDGSKETRKIVEKSVENIRTAEELATFRDKVNSGLTYEGKTIKLKENINLAGEEWTAIGTGEYPFKAIFDGGYNYISNPNASLFSVNDGIIKNLIIKNADIESSNNISGILTETNNGIINNCGIEEGSITVQTTDYLMIGGITGYHIGGTITNCYNKANITGSITSGNYVRIGGIVGMTSTKINTNIEKCYNTGNINGISTTRMKLGGICGAMYTTGSSMKNCYNIGEITGDAPTEYIAGLVGSNGESSKNPGGTITNCYTNPTTTYSYYYNSGNSIYTSTTGRLSDTTALKGYALTLGDEFIADGKIKNENGEWVDNVDDQGNVIYINGGYPILKWQIGE